MMSNDSISTESIVTLWESFPEWIQRVLLQYVLSENNNDDFLSLVLEFSKTILMQQQYSLDAIPKKLQIAAPIEISEGDIVSLQAKLSPLLDHTPDIAQEICALQQSDEAMKAARKLAEILETRPLSTKDAINIGRDSFIKTALLAYASEFISLEQFASLNLLWEARTDFQFNGTIQFFSLNEHTNNSDSIKMLSLFLKRHPKVPFMIGDLIKVIERTRGKPLSERTFAVITTLQKPPYLDFTLRDIGFEYYWQPIFLDSKWHTIVPSISMMEALFSDIHLQPVLGEVAEEHVYNDHYGNPESPKHTLGLSYPGATIDTVQDVVVGKFGFSAHDALLHGHMFDKFPEVGRKILKHLYDLVIQRDPRNAIRENLLDCLARDTAQAFALEAYSPEIPVNPKIKLYLGLTNIYANFLARIDDKTIYSIMFLNKILEILKQTDFFLTEYQFDPIHWLSCVAAFEQHEDFVSYLFEGHTEVLELVDFDASQENGMSLYTRFHGLLDKAISGNFEANGLSFAAYPFQESIAAIRASQKALRPITISASPVTLFSTITPEEKKEVLKFSLTNQSYSSWLSLNRYDSTTDPLFLALYGSIKHSLLEYASSSPDHATSVLRMITLLAISTISQGNDIPDELEPEFSDFFQP